MAQPRGLRTTHVTVYLSPAESAAWDLARSFERGGGGWAGLAPPSRATWVMDRVRAELAAWTEGAAGDGQSRLAAQALDRLNAEEHRADPSRSHGRPVHR